MRLKRLNIIEQGSRCMQENNLYRLKFGHYDSLRIGEYIYKNATIKLDRKYLKYKEFV